MSRLALRDVESQLETLKAIAAEPMVNQLNMPMAVRHWQSKDYPLSNLAIENGASGYRLIVKSRSGASGSQGVSEWFDLRSLYTYLSGMVNMLDGISRG